MEIFFNEFFRENLLPYQQLFAQKKMSLFYDSLHSNIHSHPTTHSLQLKKENIYFLCKMALKIPETHVMQYITALMEIKLY